MNYSSSLSASSPLFLPNFRRAASPIEAKPVPKRRIVIGSGTGSGGVGLGVIMGVGVGVILGVGVGVISGVGVGVGVIPGVGVGVGVIPGVGVGVIPGVGVGVGVGVIPGVGVGVGVIPGVGVGVGVIPGVGVGVGVIPGVGVGVIPGVGVTVRVGVGVGVLLRRIQINAIGIATRPSKAHLGNPRRTMSTSSQSHTSSVTMSVRVSIMTLSSCGVATLIFVLSSSSLTRKMLSSANLSREKLPD